MSSILADSDVERKLAESFTQEGVRYKEKRTAEESRDAVAVVVVLIVALVTGWLAVRAGKEAHRRNPAALPEHVRRAGGIGLILVIGFAVVKVASCGDGRSAQERWEDSRRP